MSRTKKIVSISLKILLALLVLANLLVLISGKTFIYKALIYNYVDIDDLPLFETRALVADNPIPWPVAEDYNKAELPAECDALHEANRSVAYLIIKDDSIRYENYFLGYSDSSLSNSFSVAKSVVGILIGIAIDEGKIKGLDQKVGDFLPHYSEGENNKLSIRHLLTMSAGLDWNESYSGLLGPVTELYYGTDLKKQMNRYKVITEPGITYNYMSGASQLLAIILENATGEKLADYASKKLWGPIGAVHNAEWSLDHKSGMEKAYCCIYSNARDFAKIGQLYLNNGMMYGQQIVPEWYVKESVTPADMLDQTGKQNDKYGYQWWILKHKGHDVFYARGILGQYIIVVPDQKMVIVRLGHKRGEKLDSDHVTDVFVYLDAALEMYAKPNLHQ